MPEADEPCVPDAAWPISRWAALRVATHCAVAEVKAMATARVCAVKA